MQKCSRSSIRMRECLGLGMGHNRLAPNSRMTQSWTSLVKMAKFSWRKKTATSVWKETRLIQSRTLTSVFKTRKLSSWVPWPTLPETRKAPPTTSSVSTNMPKSSIWAATIPIRIVTLWIFHLITLIWTVKNYHFQIKVFLLKTRKQRIQIIWIADLLKIALMKPKQ